MKKLRLCIFIRVFMCIMFIAPGSPAGVKAVLAQGTSPATTVIKHQAIDYFVSGHRIKIEAEVTDPAGVKLARCYFRAAGLADYVFVPMQSLKENIYEAVLPKPSKDTQTLEYILLAVNQKGQIVKTEVFRIKKNDEKDVPTWQQGISEEGEIKVSTELTQAPPTVSGFTDSITLDVVESSARFGTAVGIYLLLQGGGSDEAVKTDSSSAPEKTSEGLSRNAILSISAAIAIAGIVGGVAATGGGGNDEKDTDKPRVVEPPKLNPERNKITVTFTEPMDKTVDRSSAVTINSSDPGSQWIAERLEWSDNLRLLDISIRDIKENRSPGGTITLILEGGVFKDLNGNYMDNYNSVPINVSESVTITW